MDLNPTSSPASLGQDDHEISGGKYPLYAFEVELRRGAGAYICGEETALFEAIEGKRGFPRVKPPFPTTHGLFGKPTVINNVETLCNVPYVILHGAAEYRLLGTAKSPGTKLFCVSGDVARPGVYEVPFGVTLRHLLEEQAGGVPDGYALQTVLFGGAAGAFATPAQLDVRMTFEDLRLASLPLGSGVVMVFDERRDLRDVLRRLARFSPHESCGNCWGWVYIAIGLGLVLACLFLGACADAPPCPYRETGPEAPSAGCLVIRDGQLLVVRQADGRINLPGGKSHAGEPARCTAYREAWEETGLDLEPAELLRVFDTGFHLYHCELHSGSGVIERPRPFEIREAFFVDAAQLGTLDWRYPEAVDWLREQLGAPAVR